MSDASDDLMRAALLIAMRYSQVLKRQRAS
jgi:hypothetical protein